MANQGKEWLYFVVDSDGKTYRKEMGLIIAKSDKVPLKYSVIGWQEINIAWERDLFKWGVTRTFTLPLGFVIDGADIMRTLMYRNNFEKKVYLLIQKQYLVYDIGNFLYYYYYDLFYKGALDFTTAVDEEDKVTVSVNEGGIVQDIKANTGTDYEIPVDEVTIRMDGIELHESAAYFISNGTLPDNLGGHTIQVGFLGSEETGSIGALTQNRVKTGNSAANLWNANTYFLSASPGATVATVTWDFYMTPELASGVGAIFGTSIILQLWTVESATVSTDNVLQTIGGGDPLLLYNRELHFSGTTTITIPAGRRAVLYMSANQNREFTYFRYTADPLGSFKIAYNYRKDPTFIKALFPLTLFQRLMAKISPSATVTSALLDLFKNFCFSSGDAIRGLPGAVIKINYNDFYQSVKSVLCCSENIAGNAIAIESLSYALNESNILALGEPAEIKTEMATELIYNTIKVGYANQTYDDVNGKDEFNTTVQYSSDIKKIVKELDLISPTRADCFGIEFLRINLAGKSTTDNTGDNDAFFIDIDAAHPQWDAVHGTYYNLYRENYTSITGVLSPTTIFNVRLSPARNMLRNRPLINSFMYGFEGTKLVFQTTDKNRLLYTQGIEGIVDEDADIIVTGDMRLFKPWTFDFKPMTPTRLAENLGTNPNRCFSFVHYNGRTYNGFGLKIGLAANTLESQAYLLLSCVSNDLTTLTT